MRPLPFALAAGCLLILAVGLIWLGPPPQQTPLTAAPEPQPAPESRRARVQGQGVVEVAAETARVVLLVQSVGTSPPDLSRENRYAAGRVEEAIGALVEGLPLLAVHREALTLHRLTGPEMPEWTGASYYQAETRIHVTLADPAWVQQVIDAALVAGAGGVADVTYGLRSYEQARAAALSQAQHHARNLVLGMVQNHGVKLRSDRLETGQSWHEELLEFSEESLPGGRVRVRAQLQVEVGY